MANIERVSDQLKKIKNGFDNSNHSFMAQLVSGLQERIAEASGLDVQAVGKQAIVGQMSLNVTGSKIVDSEEEMERIKDRVRQTMDSLKNPSSLEQLLSE